MTAEVTIRVRESIIDPWGMPVGNPHDDPPVVLFMAKDIHLALRQGRVTWPNRCTLAVTRDGFATTTRPDGASRVYELFPARCDDDREVARLISFTFEAKYPGRCGACDGPFGPGDLVTYTDDELVHATCSTDPSTEQAQPVTYARLEECL